MTIKFKNLAPEIVENMNTYKEALDYAFTEKEILNVALTGIYGAGKSSVWKTYEKDKEENFCIHISLANFLEDEKNHTNQSDDKIEDNNEKILNDRKRLEGHIINQLVHQIDKDNIPYTAFKIKNIPGKEFEKLRRGIILLVIIGLVIGYRADILDLILRFIKNTLPIDNPYYLLDFIIGAFIIASLRRICCVISDILKYQTQNPIIKKISYKNNQIDLFDKKEDSLIDRNLDEILYILENSGVKAIVFEDLDRYNDISIFSKLREINFLVNQKICKKKSSDINNIKFIYLIKDDMFKSKDRTKFFDFIIPIVPSIDTNNSKEILLKTFEDDLKRENRTRYLDKIFIERLSYYIDDRRLLINIYNEFIIYKNEIGAEKRELDLNKLLAIIVYKNIFPKDFSNLQINRGYVNKIFKKKHNFINKRTDKLLKDKQKKEDDIKKLEIAIENSKVELMAIFMDGNATYEFSNYGSNRYVAEFLLEKDDKEGFYSRSYSGAREWKSKEFILNELNKNSEYVERYNRLGNENKSKRIEILKDEVKSINEEIITLKSKMLSEIIKDIEEEIFDIDNYDEVKNDHYFGVIKFLIIDGRLDELYFEYMGYFYPNSLKNEDKKFQRGVFEGDKKPYNYKLHNSKEVLRGFNKEDFRKIRIINYDLLDAIIDTKNYEYLKEMIKTILNADKIDFINGYLEERDLYYKNELVIICNKEFPNMLTKFLSNETISKNIKNLYIRITLIKSQQYFGNINKDDILKNHIKYDEYIFENILAHEEKIVINSLLELDVKVNSLPKLIGNLSENIVNNISKHKLYELSIDNINFFIKRFKPNYSDESVIAKNYSILNSHEIFKEILDYVNSNMEIYINELNRYSNNNIKYKNDIKETKDILNSKVNIDMKIQFIKYNSTKIDYLDDIKDNEIWNSLIESDTLQTNYYNTLILLNKNGEVTEELNKYFINFKDIDIKNTIDDKVKEINNREDLEMILLTDSNLNNDIHINICKISEVIFNKFDKENISKEKIDNLIEYKKINLNEDNFNFILKYYKDFIDIFIDKNYDLYIKYLEEDNLILNNDLILNILNSDILSEKRKLKILEYYDKDISISDAMNLSDNIIRKIIESNFDMSDLQFIVENYTEINCKDIIINKAIENLDYIKIDNLSKEFIFDFIENEETSEELKLRVISKIIDNSTLKEDIIEFINIGNLKNYRDLLQGHNAKLDKTYENQHILSVLEKNNLISSFKEQENYYMVFAKKSLILK